MRRLLALLPLVGLLVQPPVSDPPEEDSEFTFARIQYNMQLGGRFGGRGREAPWHHDHPYAEHAFLSVLKGVSAVRTTEESYKIVQLASPDLFNYPFVYMCEPGFLSLTAAEETNLREYLNRGGFLMIDDFRGVRDMENLRFQMRRVFPEREFTPLDLSHKVFQSFYGTESLDVIPPYGNGEAVRFYGLFDGKGNLQVVANHNDDFGEYWEWLDRGEMPLKPASESLRLGVNYLIYAMTH